MSRSNVKVVDFFSGCGGTSLGFQQAGLEIGLGIDCDAYSAETFRRNFPAAGFLERDIRHLKPTDLTPFLGSGPKLFSGCAPCQPFSRQNRSSTSADPRRSLLAEFMRFIKFYLPEFVVVENVPGAQRIANDGPFRKFLANLRRMGYSVASDVLRAGDFGVPQERRRLVIVASLDSEARLPVSVAVSDVTVRRTIEDLPPLFAGEVHPDMEDHASMKLSDTNLRRIQATPEGGGRRDWPQNLQLPCHGSYTGHSDVYGRMSWDRPSSGLTTRCLSYSNGRFGHPDQDRAISAREAARLQTFPDTFRFSGPLTEKGRQIGNAVPPTFAKSIVEALLSPQRSRAASTEPFSVSTAPVS